MQQRLVINTVVGPMSIDEMLIDILFISNV